MAKITMDETARRQQAQLKKSVVALIMNESTVLTQVDYPVLDSPSPIHDLTVTYMTGDVEYK